MNINWKIKELTPEEQAAAQRLATELEISPVAGRILAARGLRTAAEARAYIRPSLDSLHDYERHGCCSGPSLSGHR